MVEAWAALAERMAWESVVSLASAHLEADKVAQKVTLLEGEIVIARRVWDTAEAKLPGLIDKTADAEQRQEEASG
jgi:hypothetical protein